MIDRYWLPSGVAFFCQAMGIGILGIFGFFVAPLAAEFGAKVAVLNTGIVFLLIAPAFIGPIFGKFIDTHSIRNIMLWGVAIASLALLAISQMSALWMVGCTFMVYALGQVLYGPLVVNALLIKVYRHGLARALAIAAMGVSLGSIVWPFIAAGMMDNYGWRMALVTVAGLLFLGLAVPIYFFVPHDIGKSEVESSEAITEPDNSFLRQRAFWLIGISASIIFNAALLSGICYAPHFSKMGFSNTEIATFLAAGGFGGLSGKLMVATYADRYITKIRWLAVATAVLMVAGYSTLIVAESYYVAIAATVMIGCAGGAFIPLHPFLNSAYFDSETMGRVSGAQAPMMLPLGLVTAPAAGYVFDTTGSYAIAFAVVAAVLFVAMALLLAIPKSEKAS
jgi:MFS family permease